MDDKELQHIYKNYKDVTSPQILARNKNKEWLDFLSQKEIANLPVEWNDVETPTGKSWGNNVSFANIMNAAKGIKEGSNSFEMVTPTLSERLQDYAIGLHEDKKVINEKEASELITMFQNKETLIYFLENYQKIEEITSNQTTSKKATKIEPTFGPGDFFIETGGIEEMNASSAKEGIRKLGELFTNAKREANIRSEKIVSKKLDDLNVSQDEMELIRLTLRNSKELSSVVNNTYHKEWELLESTYMKSTLHGQKEMTKEGLEDINKILNEIVEGSQLKTALATREATDRKGTIITLPPPTQRRNKERKTSTLEELGKQAGHAEFEMGM